MISAYNVFKTWLVAHTNSERGANMVEYILLIVFIALVVVVAVRALEDDVSGKFDDAGDCLNEVAGAC